MEGEEALEKIMIGINVNQMESQAARISDGSNQTTTRRGSHLITFAHQQKLTGFFYRHRGYGNLDRLVDVEHLLVEER